MQKILFLTNINRQLAMMQAAVNESAVQKGCCMWIDQEITWTDKWQQILSSAGCVVIKWMGTGLDTSFLKQAAAYLQDNNKIFYIDAASDSSGMYSNRLLTEQLVQLKKYFLYGGQQNYINIWIFLNDILQDLSVEAADPVEMPWCGIYHPDSDKIYTNLLEYQDKHCQNDLLTVGILFYRDEWIWQDLNYQTALIREIEKQNMNVICVFSNGMPAEELGAPSLENVFIKFFFSKDMMIDVLINTMKFSLTSSSSLTVKSLKKFNIPVLQAYTLMTEHHEWKENFEGMTPLEISVAISLPEFDGVIHGLPIANKKIREDGSCQYIAIDERITAFINKARKWAVLRHKNNKDKKIAIIFHNYPPSNSNIGSALGLDSIESIRLLLHKMQQQGYFIDHVPDDTKAFIKELTDNATNDKMMLTEEQLAAAKKITAEDYKRVFSNFDETVQKQLTKDWGKPPGEVMHYDNNLLIPGTINGNIFITVQPPRGFGEDPDKLYHSPFTAPTHHYLAFYQWLRENWQADAVAHIGTHGSLEWLPGKNAGLSDCCYPDIALGELPNIYPYLMTITGEGIQAKRRSSACLIEYLPAPQSQAGTYDELAELENLLDEYVHFAHEGSLELDKIEKIIREKVIQASLDNEVIYDDTRPFSEYIGRLHNYITDLKNMQVHTGLHILGQSPQDKQLIDYIWLLTRLENGRVASLVNIIAEINNTDYYYLLDNSEKFCTELNITNGQFIDKIIENCYQVINVLKTNKFADNKIDSIFTLPFLAEVSKTVKFKIETVCQYICKNIYINLMLTVQEQNNMLLAFNGGYIEPGPSGAPTSGGADLLPTGRNFYGIDPRSLPTIAVWEIGKNLGQQAIARFIAEEGHYPENIGIILWAGANMRSHGQCIAEFLYLLGIKPKWQRGSLKVIGLEVIPLTELKRPRIDVTARISGLFRDAMPPLIKILDDAVLLAADLDENINENFVKKYIKNDSVELQKKGLTVEDAWRQAAYRVFGDESGAYGAGIGALLEAKNWNSIDDLADVYVRWGAHAYGGRTAGKYLPQQFRKRIGSLDITIKNEDNHETNMLSSDDYNAYHGGMIAAVRSIRKKAPRSYCGDSTDKNRIAIHSVQEETKRIFRSEAINPKFIAGMKQHGYKGAADMANYIAHSFQWDTTSNVMEDWMYEKYAEKYTFDIETQKWLREVNPWVLRRMTEVLLEAQQRNLWQAKEETLQKLRELYLSIEGDLEDRNDQNQ